MSLCSYLIIICIIFWFDVSPCPCCRSSRKNLWLLTVSPFLLLVSLCCSEGTSGGPDDTKQLKTCFPQTVHFDQYQSFSSFSLATLMFNFKLKDIKIWVYFQCYKNFPFPLSKITVIIILAPKSYITYIMTPAQNCPAPIA